MTAETDSTPQLKRALQAIKDLRARLENVERKHREPVAVIGMACRLPGGADSPEAFWTLLKNRVDGITPIPVDRWDVSSLFNADPDVPGKVATRWGGFLTQVDQFDAPFFGISPREAASMDPQQRLLLEVAWEALEDAGLPIEKLGGSRTGVFMGVHSHSNDYYLMQALDPDAMDIYTGTGTSHSVVSGRISYLFDFQGPNVALDTACSSSLVAVHLAVQSLRNNECNLALAGGVNVMLTPHFTMAASRMRMMAADGRCKAFDSRADGFVRSEGCGTIVLKRLSDALADGDPILAVIRGSAINQDGHSNGLTAPNGLAQQAVIRLALENAGVRPEQISYVETHGTGTPLGDPIEVEALGAVFHDQRSDGMPCVLGSVKTNLGHLEGAAGITGLIKTILALQYRTIPADLHFQQLNPHITLAGTRLQIADQERPWETGAERRFAGVSAFGWSGTNAHVVLEEAPESLISQLSEGNRESQVEARIRPHLLAISARSSKALKPLAQAYLKLLNAGNVPLADLCQAAAIRRSHHIERLAVVGRTNDELAEKLEAFTRDEARPGLSANHCFIERLPGIVFVFPGQGGQWLGMGRQLLEQEPVFRHAIERCEQALRPFVNWSLLGQLTASEVDSRLEEIDVVQPVLFAIQIALAELWRSWGVQPDAVVGHSMGEIAAAQVAGALSLEDAARIICTRSKLMRSVSGKGAMAVVGLPLEQTDSLLANYRDRLSVAVSNSPTSTVLSGDPAALEEVLAGLRVQNIFCRPVKVDVAAHSPQMVPLRPDLVADVQMIRPQAASIPIYSTVTGAVESGAALNADYWGRNLCQPVRFTDATQRLFADGHFIFIEINPHPILLNAVEQTAQAISGDYRLALVESLRRGEDEILTIYSALGSLYTVGFIPKWDQILTPSSGYPVELPRYPWQREHFWLETSPKQSLRAAGTVRTLPDSHPLLQERLDIPEHLGMAWQFMLKRWEQSELFEHRLNGTPMLAGSTSVEIALASADRALPNQPWVINEIVFQRALALSEDEKRPTSIQVSLSSTKDGSLEFGLYSLQGESWQPHVSAKLQLEQKENGPAPVSLNQIQTRLPRIVSGQEFYQDLEKQNVLIGRFLQGIVQLWRGDGEILARLANVPEERYLIAPALLDAGFQLLGIIPEGITDDFCMPVKAAQIRPGDLMAQPVWVHVTLRQPASPDLLVADIQWLDDKGNLVLSVAGLRLKRLALDRQVSENPADWLYTVRWEQISGTSSQTVEDLVGSWLILADQEGIGEALAHQMELKGARCTVILAGRSNAQAGEHPFVAQLNSPEDIQAVINQALQTEGLKGVVHLWSLNIHQVDENPLKTLEETQMWGCEPALSIIQDLVKTNFPNPPKVWFVTRGAQAVQTSEYVHSAQAPLWGLGRVIAEEQPDYFGGLIDLPLDISAELATAPLLSAIVQPYEEKQLAWRSGQWYTPRLVKLEASSMPPRRTLFRNDATYIITGGLGGIGYEVARWAIHHGASRLILMGRTPLPPRNEWSKNHPSRLQQMISSVKNLESLGASIHYAAIDVANEAQLSEYLNGYYQENWPPIRGVIHAAGVIDDKLIVQLDNASLNSVMRPKVAGGWLLQKYLKDQPLDFFVLFSSFGALVGQTGQGNYAAANAFLDALAHERQVNGMPGISINWGAWGGLGFAITPGGKRVLEKLELQGLEAFNAEQGLAALELLLCQTVPQAMVAPINWPRFLSSGMSRERLWYRLQQEQASPKVEAASHTVRATLLALPMDQQRAFLQTHVQTILAQVLKMSPERIEPNIPFGSLGLESLMAVEFRNRLEASLDIKLAATLVWNYPTVFDLTTFLLEKLEGPSTPSQPSKLMVTESQPPASDSNAVIQKVQAMTDEDALQALKNRHKRK